MIGAIASTGASLYGGYKSRKASSKARRDARRAAAEQRRLMGIARDEAKAANAKALPERLQGLHDSEVAMRLAYYGGDKYLSKARGAYAPHMRLGTAASRQLGTQLAQDRMPTAPGAMPDQAVDYRDPNFAGMLEMAGAGFEESPGYQYRQQEGEKAIRRLSNAGGMLGSGAMYKDLMRHNQGMASEEFGNYYNRLSNERNFSNINRDFAGRERDVRMAQYNMDLGRYDQNVGRYYDRLFNASQMLPASQVAQIQLGRADRLSAFGSDMANLAYQRSDTKASSYLADAAAEAGYAMNDAKIIADLAQASGQYRLGEAAASSNLASSAMGMFNSYMDRKATADNNAANRDLLLGIYGS